MLFLFKHINLPPSRSGEGGSGGLEDPALSMYITKIRCLYVV